MSNKACVRSEVAVSPVIGTILLVAIVVVLAAVIGVVALGLTTQSEAKVVGIVAKENSTGTGMEILLTGGRDVSQLTGLRVSGDAGSVELNETPVGVSLNVPGASGLLSSSPGLVTITGIFANGTEQMIWQGKLALGVSGSLGDSEFTFITPDTKNISVKIPDLDLSNNPYYNYDKADYWIPDTVFFSLQHPEGASIRYVFDAPKTLKEVEAMLREGVTFFSSQTGPAPFSAGSYDIKIETTVTDYKGSSQTIAIYEGSVNIAGSS